jgi:hypothetical protein
VEPPSIILSKRGDNMNMRLVTLVFIVLALPACGTIDPNNIGMGRYLQVFDRTGRVVIETDTHNAGLMNCPNQANLLIQGHPTLASLTKCSDTSFAASLPFSFIAHMQLRESDGYRPSSPYLTRVLTREACINMRDATAKMEKTIIVEDHCVPIK